MTTVPPIIANVPAPMLISATSRMISRAVASNREGYAGERLTVEQGVVTDRPESADRPAPNPERAERPWICGSQRLHRHGMSPITSP